MEKYFKEKDSGPSKPSKSPTSIPTQHGVAVVNRPEGVGRLNVFVDPEVKNSRIKLAFQALSSENKDTLKKAMESGLELLYPKAFQTLVGRLDLESPFGDLQTSISKKLKFEELSNLKWLFHVTGTKEIGVVKLTIPIHDAIVAYENQKYGTVAAPVPSPSPPPAPQEHEPIEASDSSDNDVVATRATVKTIHQPIVVDDSNSDDHETPASRPSLRPTGASSGPHPRARNSRIIQSEGSDDQEETEARKQFIDDSNSEEEDQVIPRGGHSSSRLGQLPPPSSSAPSRNARSTPPHHRRSETELELIEELHRRMEHFW